MRRTSILGTALSVLLLAALPAAAQGAKEPETFKIDPAHSSVSFTIKHLVGRVRGSFDDFSGVLTVPDRGRPGLASVKFSIRATSIDTANADRDKHLRTPDFFDVEKFPEISFESTKIEAQGADAYRVTGRFTMHGVTQEIVLPVTFAGTMKDPWGNERAGFSLETTLNRKDYGIVYNKVLDSGGLMLGDDVAISIEIEAVRAKPAQK